MMGDDDCLLPGYFKRMDEVLKKYDNPDCVTYNAYTYIAPEAINNKQSYYNKRHFNFGPDFKLEELISAKKRFSIVRDMYRFRVRIPLNMQTTLVARKAAKQIPGGMFLPPFPDHYALNALLLNTQRWVYLPENMLIVGVSPKSFGHFVYSNQQDKGLSYLGINADFKGRLPGNELLNHMHVWLGLLKTNYQDKLKNIKISRTNYVRRQVYHWYLQFRSKSISFKEFNQRFHQLSPGDWIGLVGIVIDKESWVRFLRLVKSRRSSNIQKIMHGLSLLDNILSIRDFRDWVEKTQVKG
jgi:hypothetical protein